MKVSIVFHSLFHIARDAIVGENCMSIIYKRNHIESYTLSEQTVGHYLRHTPEVTIVLPFLLPYMEV